MRGYVVEIGDEALRNGLFLEDVLVDIAGLVGESLPGLVPEWRESYLVLESWSLSGRTRGDSVLFWF